MNINHDNEHINKPYNFEELNCKIEAELLIFSMNIMQGNDSTKYWSELKYDNPY